MVGEMAWVDDEAWVGNRAWIGDGAWVGNGAWIGVGWAVRWRTGSELIHGARDGLGLDDEGERKKKWEGKR